MAVDYKSFILNAVISILMMVYTTVSCLIKLVVPYKYRSKSVKGEIALVTGSGSGIGRLMALKLAELGAKLVLVDIDKNSNEKTANEIIKNGGEAKAFTCDLSNRENIYKLADEVKQTVGDVTILVNNAGIVTGKKFLESSDASIEKIFQVNTMSHFWIGKAFLPSIIEKNHGHIVTIASMAALFGTAGLCDYTASKYAVFGYHESLRNELISLGKDKVHTTVVCPYYINTGMFDGINEYLIPLMEPEYVAERVIEAILTDQKILLLPRLMYFLYFLKGFMSIEVADFMATSLFKANSCMDNFVGRKKVY